jgi:hypothetical protein
LTGAAWNGRRRCRGSENQPNATSQMSTTGLERAVARGTKVPAGRLQLSTEGSNVGQTTRCSSCGKRLVPMAGYNGRTELQCIRCDDPMKSDRWASSPLSRPLSSGTIPVAAPAGDPFFSGARAISRGANTAGHPQPLGRGAVITSEIHAVAPETRSRPE